jgi:hypothetical protein
MGLDHRHLVDPHRQVGVEIALLHPPVREGDVAVQRRRQAEDRTALDLRLDRVRVDRQAASSRTWSRPTSSSSASSMASAV